MNFLEMHDIRNDQDLVRKIHGAVAVNAFKILQPEVSGTQARGDWALKAIKDPSSVTPEIIHYVLVKNSGVSVDVIPTATDQAYVNNVAEAINKIIGIPNGSGFIL